MGRLTTTFIRYTVLNFTFNIRPFGWDKNCRYLWIISGKFLFNLELLKKFFPKLSSFICQIKKKKTSPMSNCRIESFRPSTGARIRGLALNYRVYKQAVNIMPDHSVSTLFVLAIASLKLQRYYDVLTNLSTSTSVGVSSLSFESIILSYRNVRNPNAKPIHINPICRLISVISVI